MLYTIGFLLLLSCKEKKQESIQFEKSKSNTSRDSLSHKKDFSQQSKILTDPKNEATNKQEKQISTATNNANDNSFVLSCGSGCAMTYIPEVVLQDKQVINVKFKVETYINDKLSDIHYEKYYFVYNNSGQIEKINPEGENDNILQNLMPDAQAEFKKYSKVLLKNKNIDISKFSKTEKVRTDADNFKICALPFDFNNYYDVCVEDDKNCENKYPSYVYSENKEILETFGIKEQPSAFFLLPKINNLQPIVLAYTDSDVEGYFLKIIDNNEVVSSLQIGKMNGETIEDFVIKENYEIELYSRKNSDEKRILKKKYKLQDNGMIK
ncbi:hypothetical protein [Chryseobacterium sp. Bi04]|uniref:hypothetical protein n=1 Tax=Chryseobacterium sp. Bi04 TaxID=2822345 RepID=UPI001D5DB752|nr:hypothetical protein [Chryseobacterium sp. Bi04]CAH0266473.1 hypothetical protein SRABI04_03640 [Chryseobacterium sp. Bi04]